MERLSRADLVSVIELLADVHGIADLESYPVAVVRGIQGLVPADIYSYTDVDLRQRSVRWLEDPPASPPEMEEVFAAYAHEHPVVARHREGDNLHAYQISDFLSRTEFRRTGLYNDFYRHVGVEDQMAVSLQASAKQVIGIALCRDSFSERDRSVLELVRPHLQQAHRRAVAATEVRDTLRSLVAGLEATAHALVLLRPGGRIAHVTPRAKGLLARYFPGRRGVRLPGELAQWVTSFHQDGEARLEQLDSVLVVEGTGRLQVRYLPSADGQPFDVLVLREVRDVPSSAALAPLGLTPRQREVACLVAGGKTNQQIARLLGVQLTTVKKHLEHAYVKLGVQSRAALVARVMEAAG